MDIPVLTPEAIRVQLSKILASETFNGAHRASRLLTFLVEETLAGRATTLKEYTLGAEGLGRGAKFDPRVDATARVEASRLRTRLDLYYAKGGRNESLLISLPKGNYVPTFSTREDTTPASGKTAMSLPTAKPWRKYLTLVVAGFFIVTIVALLYRQPENSTHSIVVLPLSTEPATEYLADGLTESLINNLSTIENLRVTARSIAFSFKGSSFGPAEIGKQLKVGSVVTGRLSLRNSVLAIQVELVDTATGAQRWGERFEQNLDQLVDVQEAIAQQLINRLQLRLSREDKQSLNRRYTDNAEAYQLYLQGLYYSSKPTQAGIQKANDYYSRALERDPNFAPAYVKLATNYILLSVEEGPNERMRQAKAAVDKALTIDNDLAEAHAEKGFITWIYDLDPVQSEIAFKRALKLNPISPTSHYNYARMLAEVGRFEEALQESYVAVELDPLSMQNRKRLPYVLFLARRYDEAEVEYEKLIELAPDFIQTQRELGLVYEQQGRYAEALSQFQKSLTMAENYAKTVVQADVAHVYAIWGRGDEAQAMLDDLLVQFKQRHVSAYDIAIIYAGLNDTEQTLVWLAQALEQRPFFVGWVKVDPRLDSVRNDPRFTALLQSVGL